MCQAWAAGHGLPRGPSTPGLSPGQAGTSLGEGSPVKTAGPAGDVREGGHHEGLWENQLGHTGQRLGRPGWRQGRGLPVGRRSCSWELSHQLRGDGLSGGGCGRGTRGRTRGEQGQIREPRRSLRPQPLMCDGRTGMWGLLCADSGGRPAPLGEHSPPGPGQSQSLRLPQGTPLPWASF